MNRHYPQVAPLTHGDEVRFADIRTMARDAHTCAELTARLIRSGRGDAETLASLAERAAFLSERIRTVADERRGTVVDAVA